MLFALPDISKPHPLLSVREWRQMLQWALAHLRGEVTTVGGAGERHPWHCRVEFDPVQGRWRVQVKAGLVGRLTGSGQFLLPETLARIPAAMAPEATRERLGALKGGLDAFLSEEPWLPVNQFRAIGDGEGQGVIESVPTFFRSFGVGPVLPGERQEIPRRWLRAASVILTQPRPYLSTGWQTGADDIVSILPSARLHAQVAGAGRELLPATISLAADYREQNPELLLETLARGGDDDTSDRRLVATLYWLSPPGENKPGSKPGDGWEVFVRHELFRNLSYAVHVPRIAEEPSRPLFLTGLAGGVADVLIAGLQRVIDDNLSNAATAANLARVRGSFWSV
ncbi:MAG: hypothetical protein AB7I98_03925 [Verrucomicrobiales bacterium]